MEDNKPSLTVIEGGTSTRKRTGNKATESKLTEKQELFAQGLSEGLTNAEAYRRAYDAANMKPNVLHNEASKLAMHNGVSKRLDEILAKKRAKHSMFEGKASDRVWRNVWRLAEGADVPPNVQQSAIALAAKMAGMLTDKVEIENKTADSKSIEAELLERLQRLSA